VKGSRRLPYTL